MIQIRRAEERGHADHGWLNTYHTFSFNTYYDAKFMGFRSLRVINDDTVQPDNGFGTHPHRDMEIISYVLEGALEHKDSMGNGSVIRPGDVQRMSAGTGVLHSEFNPSKEKPVHFLQIWITPDKKGVKPEYEQKAFSTEEKRNQLRLVASKDGRDGSLSIHQDTNVHTSVLQAGAELTVPLKANRYMWLHVARGKVKMGEQTLKSGDGAAIREESSIVLAGLEESEILFFDLA